MTAPLGEVRKIAHLLTVPTDLLADAEAWAAANPLIFSTTNPANDPAWRAERAARQDAERARQAELLAEHERNLAASTPLSRPYLEMHGPVVVAYQPWPICEGCEGSGYDAEPASFPCQTYDLAVSQAADKDASR